METVNLLLEPVFTDKAASDNTHALAALDGSTPRRPSVPDDLNRMLLLHIVQQFTRMRMEMEALFEEIGLVPAVGEQKQGDVNHRHTRRLVRTPSCEGKPSA